MRICFIYSSVFRHGGIQRVVANISNFLAVNHEVEIICNDRFDIKKNPYNLNLKKIKVIHKKVIDEKNLNKKKNKFLRKGIILLSNITPRILMKQIVMLYYDNKTKIEFIEFINKQKYDIVIGCNLFFNLLLAITSNKLTAKTIGWEHNSYDSYFQNIKFSLKSKKNIIYNLLPRLDNIIVLNNIEKSKFVNSLGITPIVIENPLELYAEDKSKSKEKIIINVGRIEYIKGTDLLIEIFKIFFKNNKDWKLIIVGEGNREWEKLIEEKIIKEHLEKNIEICKFTDDISKFYTKASIYACTSRLESFGLTVLEAAEFEMPIVSFDVSGPSDIIKNNGCGFVVDKFNINKFAYYLDELANNSELREKLTLDMDLKLKKYRMPYIGQKWSDFLFQVINKK